MQGKDLLNNCPKEIKDIVEKNFGSLNSFYAYVYQIGMNQHEDFKRTGIIDSGEEDRLKQYLEKIGIDFSSAEDLVQEIISDYNEILVSNYVESLLGSNWREKIAAVEKIVNQ